MYSLIGISHMVVKQFHKTTISDLNSGSSFVPFLNFRSSCDFLEEQELYLKDLRSFVQGTL